jgi:hypothetical protein
MSTSLTRLPSIFLSQGFSSLIRVCRRQPSRAPHSSAALPHTDYATNWRSSSLFRLGGDAISQLMVKKPNKNNDTILRLPKGQTEKREELTPVAGRENGSGPQWEPKHPGKNVAKTCGYGDKKPRPRTAGASCLVGPQGLEPWTKGLCLPLRLSPPLSGLWSGLYLPVTGWPSSLYTFPRTDRGLGSVLAYPEGVSFHRV